MAFLELRNNDGTLLQLEPGGRFAHAAIRVGPNWLHAHPHAGVEVIDRLDPYGHAAFFLENPDIPDPGPEAVAEWNGKPFDHSLTWGTKAATYCARLVAELLNVPPRPMEFKSPMWKNYTTLPVGEPGLSPDELFTDLIERGFQPVSHCAVLLE